MEKLYGNESVLATLSSMSESGRLPHSFLFYGEKGLGKKTAARYLASRLVNDDTIDANPDVVFARHEGKLGGFKVEHVRDLLADAFIYPNNHDRKVYIFTDCDNMNASAQNALLKVVEEPPEYAYFIFTASSKSCMLQTVLSRVISLGLSECDESDCKKALAEKGCNAADIDAAVSCFHGNIGLCLEYIGDEAMKKAADNVRNITESIISWSEYKTLKYLNNACEDRSIMRNVLSMFDKVIRDAAVSRFGKGTISCFPEGAKRLGTKLSIKKLDGLHEIIQSTIAELDTNVSLAAEAASLCEQIYNL